MTSFVKHVLCYSNHDRSVKVGGLGELGVDFLFERFNPNTTHKNGRVILKSFQTFCTRTRPILPTYYEIKIVYQSSLLDLDVIDIKFLTVFHVSTFYRSLKSKKCLYTQIDRS